MSRRRLTKLESAFYKRHPKPNVEPSHQDILHARGLARGRRGKLGPKGKFLSKLHRYSTTRLTPSDADMRLFISMGWVGKAGGRITVKGRKALTKYRRRMILSPSPAMMTRPVR